MKNSGILNIHFIDHKWSYGKARKLVNQKVPEVRNFSCELVNKCLGAYLDVRACRGIIKCERGVRIYDFFYYLGL